MSEIDRLIRETNPEPGEPRGFEPQHGKSDGSFVRTSEDDPLPTKDPEIKAEIESLKAEVVAIKEGTSDVSDSEAQTRLQGILDKLDTVLSVSDSDVKSEMETLNTEISDIKDKLDAVIEDGAVKSQVTGSVVEVGRSENVTVTAGSTDFSVVRKPIKNSMFFVGYREVNEVDHSFRVRYAFYDSQSSQALFGFEDLIQVTDDRRGVTEYKNLKGDEVSIGIRNNDSEDREYTVVLWGVK